MNINYMFQPNLAIIRFSSERVYDFIWLMQLCHDGETSSSVVFIIITIKRRRWGGGGLLWCGYALACGAKLVWVLFLIFVAAVLCGFPVYCLSFIDVYRWWAFSYGLCMLHILCSYGNPCTQSVLFPIVCACMSSFLGLHSASVALCVAVRYRYPIPSGACSLSLGTVFFHCWFVLIVWYGP